MKAFKTVTSFIGLLKHNHQSFLKINYHPREKKEARKTRTLAISTATKLTESLRNIKLIVTPQVKVFMINCKATVKTNP